MISSRRGLALEGQRQQLDGGAPVHGEHIDQRLERQRPARREGGRSRERAARTPPRAGRRRSRKDASSMSMNPAEVATRSSPVCSLSVDELRRARTDDLERLPARSRSIDAEAARQRSPERRPRSPPDSTAWIHPSTGTSAARALLEPRLLQVS